MSAIANQSSGYTAVSLKTAGDSVTGRIIDFADYQVTEFDTKKPKFFPSGDPIMGVRVDMETNPGHEDSRVTLWAEKKNMLKAIADAVRGADKADIAIGDDLAVTRVGMDGKSITFVAAYSPAA